MTTPTLPGTIPNLLRLCSPVLAPASKRVRAIGRRAIVIGEHLDTGGVLLADGAIEAAEDLALDLSDPTGRAHAAWWLNDHDEDTLAQATRAVSGVDDCEAWRWLIVSATSGDAWPDARVEYLRLVCLHVAGVSHG